MTKAVRIENADSGVTFNLEVETWDRGRDGAPDSLVKTELLNYPTAMATINIWSDRYLIVKEPL